MFHLGNFGFVIFNIFLVLVWIGVGTYLYREHEEWKRAAEAPPAREFGAAVRVGE